MPDLSFIGTQVNARSGVLNVPIDARRVRSLFGVLFLQPKLFGEHCSFGQYFTNLHSDLRGFRAGCIHLIALV